jgi:hypothetical protein
LDSWKGDGANGICIILGISIHMIFGEDELVLYDDGEGIKSGGYLIDSDMLRRRAPAMYTMNGGGSGGSGGSSVSDIFADLVVPAGLYFNGGAGAGDKSDCAQCGEHTVLPDDIYDTLLKHAEVRSRRAVKPTRKHGSATKRKTRRAPK